MANRLVSAKNGRKCHFPGHEALRYPIRMELHYLLPDPFEQFQLWWKEAEIRADLKFPNAMSLATVDASGRPSVRVVLLKGVHQGGFDFYTNYQSRKGADLSFNPQAALCFYWDKLQRQIRVEGEVELISESESDAYFQSRPRESQLGAWASEQSKPLESRSALEDRFRFYEEKFQGGKVPRPSHWGGYRLIADHLEFWQMGEHRLHDRFVYEKENGVWKIQRLNP